MDIMLNNEQWDDMLTATWREHVLPAYQSKIRLTDVPQYELFRMLGNLFGGGMW